MVWMAELWGIYTALSLAWQHGFRYIILESDSKVAVQLVNQGCGHKTERLTEATKNRPFTLYTLK